MYRFVYIYQGITYESSAEYFKDGSHKRYKVMAPDGLAFIIGRFGIPGVNGKIIWVQSNKPGEVMQPHDLVQAIGEGLEVELRAKNIRF